MPRYDYGSDNDSDRDNDYSNRGGDEDSRNDYDEDYRNNSTYHSSPSKISNYNIDFNYFPLNETIKNYDMNIDIINRPYLNNSVNLNNLDDSINLDDSNELSNDHNSFYMKIKMDELINIEKKKYIDNKHEYFTKKKIFTLLNNCGAGIFGGSIRDSLLHDYGANKFYEYINGNVSYLNNLNLIYGDNKFHPESFTDRNLIFNDIDTVMNNDHFKLFLLELDLVSVCYDYTKYDNFEDYIDISNLENLVSSYITLNLTIESPYNENIANHKFVKNFGIKHFFKNFKRCYFKIDILLCNEGVPIKKVLDIITSNSDFYCNSLYLFNNKLEISEENAKKIKEKEYYSSYKDIIKRNIDVFLKKEIFKTYIINIVKIQILEKKAISLNLSKKTEKRISKMKIKNFKLIYNQYVYEYVIGDDNICILCRSEFDDSNTSLEEPMKAIKFKCCNSYYHKKCLIELCILNQYKNCIYCNKITDYEHINLFLSPTLEDTSNEEDNFVN